MAGPVSWHERGTRQPRPRECSWPSQAARRRLRSGVAPSFVAVGTAIACRAEMALLKRRMWQLGAAGLGRARHSRPRAELRSTRRRQGTNVFPQLLTRVQAPESAGTAPRPPTARLRSAGRGSRRGARGRRSGTGNGARSLARGRPDAHCEASRPSASPTEGGARSPGRPHTGPAGPSVPSQTAASLSTSDQLAGRQPGVTWAVTLLPDFPSPAPAGLPVTSPGSSALGSAAPPVTPPEATCPAPSSPMKGSASSLPLVTIQRRAGLPPGGQGPRVCPWHLPSDASMCSRPGVGSVNRKLTVTWRERLVLRAWGDLVRSSQGTRGWPRPRPTAEAEVGAQRPGEGHAPVGAEAGTANRASRGRALGGRARVPEPRTRSKFRLVTALASVPLGGGWCPGPVTTRLRDVVARVLGTLRRRPGRSLPSAEPGHRLPGAQGSTCATVCALRVLACVCMCQRVSACVWRACVCV